MFCHVNQLSSFLHRVVKELLEDHLTIACVFHVAHLGQILKQLGQEVMGTIFLAAGMSTG